ncbi:hypothetical protein BpHYR1_011755 [Brachionus plicatilis]|uniref:Uncharacterized protein n=1 Tax=Brachionus plicatilis TaxID=10195 RepID=A0A3M7P8R4_BRAPC|nr:hypothetical protein BpHYR1_011755 [Brachionus plicatilis]
MPFFLNGHKAKLSYRDIRLKKYFFGNIIKSNKFIQLEIEIKPAFKFFKQFDKPAKSCLSKYWPPLSFEKPLQIDPKVKKIKQYMLLK